MMLRQIIQKQHPTTRGELRQILSTLKNFEGATGRTSFNEKREAVKPLFFLSVDNRGVKELNPEGSGTGGSGS
jgi:branched-chain amino acid transport system substrate-binding protein